MLDTFSIAEVWRRHVALPEFSKLLYERLRAATHWLRSMVQSETGDGPNLGANDGARLLPLADTDYRDYRSSVQLAMGLFAGKRAYEGGGEADLPFAWLDVPLPESCVPEPKSRMFDDGGYAVLRQTGAMAVLRYPRFHFRPSHADALHLDFWVNGVNHLRDAGTYSYSADSTWLAYFPGTVSHNTIQFDDRDQMPRLGRFLFGDWVKTEYAQPLADTGDAVTTGVGYRDAHGAVHERAVALSSSRLTVNDAIGGFWSKAVLRWRLQPGAWRIEDRATVTDGRCVLSIGASMPIARFSLVQGWESRYYMQKTQIPVLEVEVHASGTLTTDYRWSP
jgi:hypothetical protein